MVCPIQSAIAKLDEKAAQYWNRLRYHPLQSRLWTTIERGKRFISVAAGRGSGKTVIARRKIILQCVQRHDKPNPMYFYGLPTYSQAKRVAWEPLIRSIPRPWIQGKPNLSELCVKFVNGAELWVVGMDNPIRIEGNQWDGGILDEACDQKPKAFDLSIVPALTHNNGWCWQIGVPKRRGVGAKQFKHFCENVAEEHYTWPSWDILTPEQLAGIKSGLDAKDFDEQFGANWVNASGGIFHAFDSAYNVADDLQYNPEKPLVIGSDFNVDPMAWTIGQIHKQYQTDNTGARCEVSVYCVFDMLYLRNTNTRETLDTLAKRYGHHTAGFYFFGDASSRARKTSASVSDYLQIKNDRRFSPAKIIYPRANPRIADRFATTNKCLRSANDLTQVLIHPRCSALITDLESRAYKEGSNEPDDHDDLGHATDALGYVLHSLWPYRIETNSEPEIVFSAA